LQNHSWRKRLSQGVCGQALSVQQLIVALQARVFRKGRVFEVARERSCRLELGASANLSRAIPAHVRRWLSPLLFEEPNSQSGASSSPRPAHSH
jgi:hypothetical protein